MVNTGGDTGRGLALGKSQTLARVMDRARAITAGLKEDNERACFTAVLGRHREFLVKGLSAHYPIDSDLLERYADEWDWKALSANPALNWRRELIDCYKDKWDWGRLSCNAALPWSAELIEHFEDHWSWGLPLSSNTVLPWSLDIIERYAGRWDWGYLSENANLPWTLEFIERYGDRWNWGNSDDVDSENPFTLMSGLSANPALPWSLKFLEHYADRWDWGWLSWNSALPWSQDLLDCYADRWDWTNDSGRGDFRRGFFDRLAMEYPGLWYWTGFDGLSDNPGLPWTLELIERYFDRWDWRGLARNPGLPWNPQLIKCYAERWDWSALSENTALPWTQGLIDCYADRWDWSALSGNKALPWTEDLIERYVDRWDWGKIWNSGLSANRALPWSAAFLARFESRWDFAALAKNPLPMWRLLQREDIIALMDDSPRRIPPLTFADGLEAYQTGDYDRGARAKLGQLNSGIDPEMLAIMTEMATFHLEAGARRFSELAHILATDLGVELEKLRPFLRSVYNGARDMMEDHGLDIAGMDSADNVKTELNKLVATKRLKADPMGGFDPGKGTMGAGPVFNEDTWARAKPLFVLAVQEYQAGWTDIKDVIRAIVQALRDHLGLNRDGITAMAPYITRFADEVRDGTINLRGEDVQSTNENASGDRGPTGDRGPADATPAGDGRGTIASRTGQAGRADESAGDQSPGDRGLSGAGTSAAGKPGGAGLSRTDG
jgi:hypothetical protein